MLLATLQWQYWKISLCNETENIYNQVNETMSYEIVLCSVSEKILNTGIVLLRRIIPILHKYNPEIHKLHKTDKYNQYIIY